jgi:hypothetical protein
VRRDNFGGVDVVTNGQPPLRENLIANIQRSNEGVGDRDLVAGEKEVHVSPRRGEATHNSRIALALVTYRGTQSDKASRMASMQRYIRSGKILGVDLWSPPRSASAIGILANL